jgi:flagellar biogenesis protein FliO
MKALRYQILPTLNAANAGGRPVPRLAGYTKSRSANLQVSVFALIPLLLSAAFSQALAASPSATDVDANRPQIADTAVTPSYTRITATFDKEPILRAAQGSDSSTSSGRSSDLMMDVPRLVGAMALVLGLIFLLRWLGPRLFSAAPAASATRAVQVLSRSLVAPRQSVVLMRVGRRLLVVSDNGSQLASLAQITDPDEVAALVGQLQNEKLDSAGKTFGALFSRLKKDDELEVPPIVAPTGDDESHVSAARAELSGLMEQVRLVTRQFKGT